LSSPAPEQPQAEGTSEGQAQTKKTADKVVKGKVIQRKKPLGKRFKEMFGGNGEESFGQYLVSNVVEPMIKDMILSIITQTADGIRGGIEERLFGEAQTRSTRTVSHGTGRPRVNYTRYSSSTTPTYRSPNTAPPAPRIIRRSNVIEDIILETRQEGEDVIAELNEIIASVRHCTVGDLYASVGIRPKTTDEGWGWDDLRSARVTELRSGGYLLLLPPPIPIEN
jgi:hypothetical protein